MNAKSTSPDANWLCFDFINKESTTCNLLESNQKNSIQIPDSYLYFLQFEISRKSSSVTTISGLLSFCLRLVLLGSLPSTATSLVMIATLFSLSRGTQKNLPKNPPLSLQNFTAVTSFSASRVDTHAMQIKTGGRQLLQNVSDEL